jgi:hypothetical protein
VVAVCQASRGLKALWKLSSPNFSHSP